MAIVSPMLAQLGVADVGRSVAFYRDVLGFGMNWSHEENGRPVVAELQLGAAKLQVAGHEGVRDTPEQRSSRHSIILFFECDSVEALHESIVRRGGKPGSIKAVDYWMKMKLFEMADLDHHTLWIGERMT